MILPAPRLRQLGREDDVRRLRDRADLLRHVRAQLLQPLDRALLAPLSVTYATIAWPVGASLRPQTAASATLGVVDERRLDLDRRDAVAGDVHHVVDAAEQPEVAVLVDSRAVAGEVHAGELYPVGRAETRVVAVDAARHRRPRRAQHEVAAAARADLVALLVVDRRVHARGTAASPSPASSS